MKINTILALGLGVFFLNIGAADPAQQKIRVINNTGYEIELQVGRWSEGVGYGAINYTYADIEAGRDYTIPDSSQVEQLGVRFKHAAWGYLNKDAAFDPVDVSDQHEHPGDTLVIAIESYRGYDSYLYFDFKRNWLKPSEGTRIEEDWQEVKDLSQSGKDIYSQITGSGRQEYIAALQANPEDYLQNIATFLSYLFKLAVEKGQGFEEGTFLVEDPQGSIYNFLDKYPEASDRTSSHLVEYFQRKYPEKVTTHAGKKATRVRGIDVVQDVNLYNPFGESMIPTQGGKRHLFFMRVGDYTLIKPENWGTSWSDILPHGYEFVVAQARKTPALQAYFGTDDEPNYRKERIPGKLLNHYKEIVGIYPNSDELTARAKAYGIHEMVDNLQRIKQDQNIDASIRQKARLLFEVIQGDYDHLDVRIGREVIITQDELETGSA